MRDESSQRERAASNFGTDRNVRKKIRPWEREIPFRDLVLFASPQLPDKYLSELTGADPRTARRWLRKGDCSASGEAMRAVSADILARLKL